MIQGKWFSPEETCPEEFREIRKKVFGYGFDANDAVSWKAVLYDDGIPAAIGRIWWEDGSYRLGDIGVLPEQRRRGLGDLALRLLLYKAQNHFAREVRLFCSKDTEAFFERLGLQTVNRQNGKTEMMIAGENINLDSCKSCPKTDCLNRKI